MFRQRGVSLSGLLVVGFLVVIIAITGMRVVPAVVEYFSITKALKTITGNGSLSTATVAEVRTAFDKQADIDNITSINGTDLDISKDNGDIVIAFAYTKKIPLGGPVSLDIDFKGSTAGKDKGN
ncbi:DUF4845 domain-containing protein [Azospira inquinata]|uniref:DUF4845 domain-containing protein n=1 Tax=Azospira inquinata TaxID=2785627 RepID=A0A975XUN4_9RHOO|nr:DUF4845 domain-containing protein [Azospira inquinata]QWT45698.1 DUF4845 domain-containing protein [Azospira inquinata]QWT48978.1 DUF4845 domain-containing protein [Azospira inquinata]